MPMPTIRTCIIGTATDHSNTATRPTRERLVESWFETKTSKSYWSLPAHSAIFSKAVLDVALEWNISPAPTVPVVGLSLAELQFFASVS